MKLIKLGFTDTFDGAPQFFLDTLNKGLGNKYRFDRDDESPNILIFGDSNFGVKNREPQYYDNPDIFRIFYTGENTQPTVADKAHASLTFEHTDNPWQFRLPLFVINLHYLNQRFGYKINTYPIRMIETKSERYDGREFCGYVQSNPRCEFRNQFFDKLNSILPINSAGPHKNNTGITIPRGEEGVIRKMEWLNKHRFSLAIENGSNPGYATEKILEAWLAGTVPIYWGSPTIRMDFNPKAFLNWHDFKDDDAFINQIQMVNDHSVYYESYFFNPLWTEFHWTYFDYTEKFVRWFDRTLDKIQS